MVAPGEPTNIGLIGGGTTELRAGPIVGSDDWVYLFNGGGAGERFFFQRNLVVDLPTGERALPQHRIFRGLSRTLSIDSLWTGWSKNQRQWLPFRLTLASGN
jgi:hypothetical protein